MQRNYLLFFPKVEGLVCNRMEGLNFNEKIHQLEVVINGNEWRVGKQSENRSLTPLQFGT